MAEPCLLLELQALRLVEGLVEVRCGPLLLAVYLLIGDRQAWDLRLVSSFEWIVGLSGSQPVYRQASAESRGLIFAPTRPVSFRWLLSQAIRATSQVVEEVPQPLASDSVVERPNRPASDSSFPFSLPCLNRR